MRYRIVFVWVVICVMWLAKSAGAHHVSGHGSRSGNGIASLGSFNPISSQSRRPETFLDYSFNVDRLDGSLGYVLIHQWSGEYSFRRRFSVGGRIPLLSIRENFLPDTDGFGDLAISFKALVGEESRKGFILNAGSEVSFPTGSESKGTGSGSLMLAPFISLSKAFKPISLFFALGSTLALENPISPSLDYSASVMLPLVTGALPLEMLMALQGSTVVASRTFTEGSTKVYFKPALALHLTQKTLATFGAKISVIDTWVVKSGVTLSRLSTVPLGDVEAGFVFDINYSF